MKRGKNVVKVEMDDGTVVKHAFASKKEMRAFVRGLAIRDYFAYTFDGWVSTGAIEDAVRECELFSPKELRRILRQGKKLNEKHGFYAP